MFDLFTQADQLLALSFRERLFWPAAAGFARLLYPFPQGHLVHADIPCGLSDAVSIVKDQAYR